MLFKCSSNHLRQRKWICLEEIRLGTVIEGKMEGKKRRGRPRQLLLDWMMADGYGKLKEEVQQRW